MAPIPPAASGAGDPPAPAPDPVVPPPAEKGKGGRPTGSKNKKGRKEKAPSENPRNLYTDKEDVMLCKAWTNASMNSIKGSDMKGDSFWQKIWQNYEELRAAANLKQPKGEEFVERKKESLKDRWSRRIVRNCHKYMAVYRRLKIANKSGWSEQTYRDEAAKELEETNKPEKWTWDHCMIALWQLKAPGYDWKTPSSSDDDSSSNKKPAADGVAKGVNNPETNMMGAHLERTVGSKAAKRLLAHQMDKA
jgi:hypothetical protein